MLRQKTFTKVTGRGSVNKVIREHYLRDDIPCGVVGCEECARLSTSHDCTLLDPSKQVLITTSVGKPHIVLPDTNILLHHLDVLERAPFTDVVVLQTVLEEVKGNSLGIHRRVRSLIAQGDRRIYVFSNENNKHTFVEKLEGETDNDRNDRSIRQASAWYGQHLKKFNEYGVVLLTNDAANARLAKEAGIVAMNLKEYCRGLVGVVDDATMILDMLETPTELPSTDGVEYSEYLSVGLLQAGVQAGKYYQGTMQISPYNSQTGSISCDATTIRIVGRSFLNRAMQGDSVAVELLPRDQWISEKHQGDEEEEAKDATEKTTEGNIEEIVSFPAIETVPDQQVSSTATPCGRVVGILKRSLRSYCGSIDRKSIRPDAGTQNVLVVPLDRRMPRIRIRTSNATNLATMRLLVSIDGWQVTSKYPHGHLVRVLGTAGEKSTETEVILLEHDVAYADFTPQVLSCLPSADWKPLDSDYLEREDFRHLTICSVDPPGCTDIDDALHAFALPNGNIEVGVHIADVTHFVRAETPLDKEASSRSTTVYLVDRRIDMLPGLLGTNLCSLKSNVERFAFSCIWELTPEAQIVSTRFCKSVIASKASFTYDEAQSRLEDEKASDPLAASLKLLNSLAKQLKARRVEAGALTLASPEVRFTLETDTMNPVDVILKEMKDANSMVEEFMLLANISVAMRIYAAFPDTAVLRRHPSPPADNFAALNHALAERNVPSLEVSTSKSLADSLDRIVDRNDPFFNRLVRIMTTRCMYQAQYFAAGSVGYDAFWHYGLACPIYTHFTSPIRRYSDVLVHRLLAASLDAVKFPVSGDRPRLEEICNNMNYRHRMAQQAQRSSIELYTHLFFKGKTVIETAYVIKIMANGIVGLIPKYGIEGLVKWDEMTLKSAGVTYDSEGGRFTKEGRPFLYLFQKISISISVEEIESSQRQKLVVHLVEPALKEASDVSSRPMSTGQKRAMEP
ncbi:VacB and RNase II family 3'-5' exoribonuclease [Paramicrosporidium saccamoebae]|uniref:Ribosomal RNA-processing protein 44 n=1 Tax=Paramicrosporidium saccamoebae TaxID=1246581 RepID=A0A2H9TGI7_9FUNG|nr:VacB and RNase II family 3'-5' exoribonuclease [Paramicrosporidium saccamoebae]